MKQIILTPFSSDSMEEQLALVRMTYSHGNTLAVIAYCKRSTFPDGTPAEGLLLEPYATLTVNLPGCMFLQSDTRAFVDTNNCPQLASWLVAKGIAKETGLVGMSGFCTYPLMEFDLSKMNEEEDFKQSDFLL